MIGSNVNYNVFGIGYWGLYTIHPFIKYHIFAVINYIFPSPYSRYVNLLKFTPINPPFCKYFPIFASTCSGIWNRPCIKKSPVSLHIECSLRSVHHEMSIIPHVEPLRGILTNWGNKGNLKGEFINFCENFHSISNVSIWYFIWLIMGCNFRVGHPDYITVLFLYIQYFRTSVHIYFLIHDLKMVYF